MHCLSRWHKSRLHEILQRQHVCTCNDEQCFTNNTLPHNQENLSCAHLASLIGSVLSFGFSLQSEYILVNDSRKARGVATRTCIWRFDAPGTFPKTILQRNQFVNQFLETDCNLIAKQTIASPLDLYPRFSIWLQCGLRFDWTSTRLSKNCRGLDALEDFWKNAFHFLQWKKHLKKVLQTSLHEIPICTSNISKGWYILYRYIYIYDYIHVYNMYTTYFFENMEMTSKP